jgi:tetratricopeptide (TPR) repeat protein
MLCTICGRDAARPPDQVCDECRGTRFDSPGTPPAAATDLSAVTNLSNPAPPLAVNHRFHGPLTPGTSFGNRYRVIRLLGAGGMGAVYQAWDDELGEAVALKVIRPESSDDPDAARGLERRFKRELVLARQVTHKNVVRIHDLGEVDGIKYLTMPYVQGTDLAALLRREGKVPIARTLAIARQIAAGLVAAHDAGVVHRDLKPANVMLDSDDRAIIMDFGIARSISGGAGGGTVAGAVVGTLEYMAPEQAMGQAIDHRADIYAFGLIVSDMLIGRRPSSRAESAVAALMERIQRPLPPLRTIDPSIPEAVDAIITRCVQPDPSARFQTTAELVAALSALDASGAGTVDPVTGAYSRVTASSTSPVPPAESAHEARRLPRTVLLAAAAVAIAVLTLVTIWMRSGDPHPVTTAASLTRATSVAIVPFRNASGDPALDWVGESLASTVTTGMTTGNGVRAVPSERVFQILNDLRVSTDMEADELTVRRLAEFSAAEHVLTGKYVRVGSRIRIQGTLRTMKTGATAELATDADGEGDLIRAVTRLTGDIRRRLTDTGPAAAAAVAGPSTQSVEALRAFTEGLELRRRGKHLDALKRFQHAVEADAAFALAHSKLGETYASLGQDADAELTSRRAVQRAASLPQRERYEVLAAHARITNDHDKAIQAYESLAKVSPGDSQVLFDLASAYEATGAYDRAHDTLRRVLELDPQFSNGLFALGRVEIRRGNTEAALEHLNRALSLTIQSDNTELKGTVLNALGIAYKLLGKPEDALRYYSEALEIRRRIGDQRGVAGSLNELGQIHAQLKRPQEALAKFQESLAIRRELNDSRGMANVLLDLGNLFTDRGEYESALKMLKQSLQIQMDVGDQNAQGGCLNSIGNVYLLQSRYDEALTYFQRALQIWEGLKLSAFVADGLHNVAETYTHIGQYDKALSHYLRALELRRTANDRRGAAIESFSMGTLFEHQGRYRAALDARKDALDSFRGLNDPPWLTEVLIGYGSTLALVARTDQARAAIDESLALARDLGHPRLVALALNAQGSTFFYRGEFKQARASFEGAQKVLAKTATRDIALTTRLNLAKVDVKEGRGRSALAALRQIAIEADELRLRAIAAECSLYLGEASLATGDLSSARSQLESAAAASDTLGLRPLSARGQYLLGVAMKRSGDESGAGRHLARAREIVDALRKEAPGDDLLARDDLRPIAAIANASL